jgi:hypothetical protein
VLEAVHHLGSTAAPAPTPAATKPFKDYLQQLPVYTGEASGLPEAFLAAAAFRVLARQADIPLDERTRQLCAKFAGNAHRDDWFTT